MVFKSTWLAPYTGSAHVIFGRTIALKEMIYTCLYPSFLRDHKMYTHLFASRSFPLTWDQNLQSFCNVTPSRVKLSLWSMPHSGGKSGVTPFLAIQSSLHLLVLQLISLTSVRSKNAFSAFCDSSTLFLRTVTRIEVSSAYLVRSLSWQYRATSRSFKNSLNKYPWVVPRLTSFQLQTVLWQTILCFLSDKKLTYQLTMYGFKGLCVNFSINKLCLTLSKAFEKSIVNSLTARLSLLSKAWRNSCCILRSAFVQLPPVLYANWLLFK